MGLGLVILDNEQSDFSLSDYIPDSTVFIQFITAIEEELGEDLPDDFLDFDILSSSLGFAEKLGFFMESLKNESDNASLS